MAIDNARIAADVLGAVGGKENVKGVVHCMTRLRFTLKDESAVNDDAVKAVDGVAGLQKMGGQYQVIVGTNVPEVYSELCKLGGFSEQDVVDENLDVSAKKEPWTAARVGNACLNYLSGSVVPLLPILIAGALFKTLASIFGPTLLGWLAEDDPFIFLCNMMYNAAFYFMPIVAGFSAARYLKINPFMGAFLGAALIESNFVALASTEGASFAVYGIPAPALSYTSTLIPILLSVAAMAPIQRLVDKYLPNTMRTMFSSFITFLIVLPITFCLTAPPISVAIHGRRYLINTP